MPPAPTSDDVDVRFQRAGLEATLFGTRPELVVGRYRILSRLGRGGMGSVYEAYDPRLDRRVAIKVLRRDSREPTAPDRLVREARTMARLSHPNVLEVFEVGLEGGQVFVAMERIDGTSLQQWQRAPHDVAEICEVYTQAARGLAAAHAAGIVHRDFKPHNALIDASGRVRVMDFGLAGQLESTEEHASSTSTPAHGDTLEHASLTRTGARLGTPAYMSPEQHAGEPATPRSDQWSFCVALFEALHGRLPFEAETHDALVGAIAAARIPFDRDAVRIPAWLRAILCRGLQPDPEARFPSMHGVVEALHRGPARADRRRRAWWLGGSVALTGIVVLAVAPRAVDSPCDAARASFAGVWDDARRSELGAVLGGEGSSHAQWTARRVATALDDYTRRWSDAHAQACAVRSAARPDAGGPLVDRTLQCLDRRRQAVAVLLDAWTDATEPLTNGELGLPSIESCADPEGPAAALPDDPQDAAEVVRIREALTIAEGRRLAGDRTGSLALVEPLVERVRALDFAPLVAETMLLRGQLAEAPDEAEPALEAAYFAGEAAGDWATAAEAATLLVVMVGERLERHEAGLAWAEHARAALARQGRAPGRELLTAIGAALHRQGDLDQALAHHRQALELPRDGSEADELAYATTLEGMAAVHLDRGAQDEAREELRQAQAILEARLGPEHPRVASVVATTGDALRDAGDLEDALTHYRLATEIAAASLGPDHPAMAGHRFNVAQTLARLGRHAEALEAATRALALVQRTRPEGHPMIAQGHTLVGMQLAKLGHYDEALAELERAHAIFEAAYPAGHPEITRSLERRVMVYFSTKDYARALGPMTQVVDQLAAYYGPDHFEVGRAQSNLGSIYMNLGKNEAAVRHFERALAIGDEHLGRDHPNNAVAHANLGEAWTNLGDFPAAIAHIDRALEIQRAALGDDHRDVAFSLRARADAERRAGDTAAARADAAASLAIYERTDAPAHERGAVRYLLAELSWPVRARRAEAREQMARAAADYHAAGETFADRARDAEAWLAEHPA